MPGILPLCMVQSMKATAFILFMYFIVYITRCLCFRPAPVLVLYLMCAPVLSPMISLSFIHSV